MVEQPNVQARKKAARKKTAGKGGNSAAPGPGSQLPASMPQVNNIMAVVVPTEIFEQMKRCVRQLPYEDVELLIGAMKNLAAQQVTMTVPGQG